MCAAEGLCRHQCGVDRGIGVSDAAAAGVMSSQIANMCDVGFRALALSTDLPLLLLLPVPSRWRCRAILCQRRLLLLACRCWGVLLA
jgi:hypothetical protein